MRTFREHRLTPPRPHFLHSSGDEQRHARPQFITSARMVTYRPCDHAAVGEWYCSTTKKHTPRPNPPQVGRENTSATNPTERANQPLPHLCEQDNDQCDDSPATKESCASEERRSLSPTKPSLVIGCIPCCIAAHATCIGLRFVKIRLDSHIHTKGPMHHRSIHVTLIETVRYMDVMCLRVRPRFLPLRLTSPPGILIDTPGRLPLPSTRLLVPSLS